jgi:arabinofuranan 3-O-arabinosyltransferase
MPAALTAPDVAGAPPGAVPRSVERLRLSAVSLAIALLVFAQSSGATAADTKLDLVVDPARFLHRAMSLWDPTGNSGQLQDQAYGYLFPMGPFFLLGKLIALPPWMIQRGWESALLIVAFLGARRLAGLLGVRGFWPGVAAGLSYALAPRMLTELFSISAELLPVAVLPLAVIPLVHGSRQGPVRTAAMRSGFAILLAGGINASATLAILPVPALWLLTRSRGPRRAALLRWWVAAVLLGCLWWLIPLVQLGRYSPPFLNWIESAAVTTSQNSLIAVARGADHWQAYLGPNIWPAGWIYAVAPAAILATALVAGLGFAGLALRGTGERLFLLSCLVLGFVLLTLGHSASLGGPFAAQLRQLLDGPLVAFRNIHKFDPLVRLPLSIGVGYLVAAAMRRAPDLAARLRPTEFARAARLGLALGAIVVGVVALSPAIGNYLVQQPRATVLAGYWPQAARWLDAHSAAGRALVLPGAGRPEMYWGSTIDEPLQAAATSPWATREIVPDGQPGYVRFLDAVELMVAGGTPQPELAALLRRAGIGYVVVRADLVPTADATPVGVVASTLASSPGFTPAAAFGPVLRDGGAANRVIDGGVANRIPAIQILQVQGAGGPVSLLAADGSVRANGSADELPALLAAGVGPGTPVLFGSDGAGLTAGVPRTALTDGIRKREVQFGHPGYVAATMTAGQPFENVRAAHDYLPVKPGQLSTMQYQGIADVRASSSGSDATAFVNRGPEHAPWYALDGDPATAWESGSADGAVGQWLELDLIAPVADPSVSLQFAAGLADYPTSITVRTDSGTANLDVIPDDLPQRIAVPRGVTQTIRITVRAMRSGRPGVAVGIASLSVGGIFAQRSLDVPATVAADLIAFQAAPGRRTGCLAAGRASACLPGLQRAGEEDAGLERSFDLAGPADYQAAGTATLLPGPALDALLDSGDPVGVSASSTADADPRHRPGAVVDGLPGTTWSAAAGDLRPVLTLTLPASTVTGFTVQTAADAPVSTPSRFQVSAAGHSWQLRPDATGTVTFPVPVRTSTVRVQILSSTLKVSTDSVTGDTELLPTGISELALMGPALPAAGTQLALPCGQGPALVIDGRRWQTSVRADLAAALAGAPLPVRVCAGGTVPLAAGPHTLALASTPLLVATGVRLARPGALVATPAAQQVQVVGWGSTHRSVRVATTAAALLVVHENFNAGWQARLGGRRLAAIQVDGWQQGFVVPAGATGLVSLTYTPDRTFTAGLLLGLLAALLLIVLAWPVRRWRVPAGRELPGLRAGVLRAGLPAAGAVVLLGALAGWVGLALGVVLAAPAVCRAVAPVRQWLPLAAAGGVAVAGLLNAIGPSVSSHPLTDTVPSQALVLLSIAAVLLALLTEPAPDAQPPAAGSAAPSDRVDLLA